MTDASTDGDVRRQAGWLPDDQDGLEAWLAGHAQKAAGRGERVELHPAVAGLRELIDTDPVLGMYFDRMISQVPRGKPYRKRHLHSVPQLLGLLNEVLTTAPEFSEDAMVITPIGAILDWASATPAGFAAFRDPRVNSALKAILTAWCEFLDSPDSRYVLNDSPTGWTSAAAREAIGIEQYQHDPDDEHWGFRSWNDFFTRRFNPGQRPIAAPDDDTVIVSSCESTPYGITTDVRRRDRFWIKTQPYSLHDMLAGDASVDRFVGGTIYQAYLSATNYHRWHAPVAGTIVRAFVQDGTYYSEADTEGSDAVEPQNSQSYLAHVAARAVILIQADNPAVGLMAFVPVGMSDVSSCVIHPAITPGRHVSKGDELGFFQFGGSTHCLVFGPGAIAGFALRAIPQPHDPRPSLVQMGSHLATTT